MKATLAVLGFMVSLPACVPGASNRPAPAARAASSVLTAPPNPWGDDVRSLLAPQCGSCHVPGLPTSKPRALLVFNFIDEPWYAHMSAEQIVELGRRAQGSRALTEADREKVVAFVRCATGGSCAAP